MQAGTRPELSQSQHCAGCLGGPERGGAPQGLTSQLRSLSLVTVRSAKSPRLTSPPPIVSMMKTSEEKPKEPGRGRGGRGQRGAGKERERQREAERGEKGDREAGREQDQELQLERKRQGEPDRQTGQDREKEGDRDRQTNFWDREAADQRLGLNPEDTEARGLALQPPSAVGSSGLGHGVGAAYLRGAGAGGCQEAGQSLWGAAHPHPEGQPRSPGV